MSRPRLFVWLLVAFVVVLPAAQLGSGPSHGLTHYGAGKDSRPAPNVFRQAAPAAGPAVGPLVPVGRVVPLEDRGGARIAADPPFVPPRG